MDTVAVTGGNGELGSAVLSELAERGYHTVNLSRGERRESVADEYRRTDLLDPGEVYGSLASAAPDAVAHFGTIPRPDETPGHVTFRSNAQTPYHVLDAAEALDVETVVLASSLSAMGASFEDEVDVRFLPVDETHPLTPSNPYGLGKQVAEAVADGFGRRERAPTTVASLRFPLVTGEAELRTVFAEADRSPEAVRDAGFFEKARKTLFAYLHVDDAVALATRALEADFAGHEVFFGAARDTTVAAPSSELAGHYDAEIRESFEGYESLIDTGKADEWLGWSADRSWRDL
ncbi:NAD(P)-dependent oxidoreductase [Halorussus sp. MSC15.2]|uniref:NAD-dependent epimerase/dehydratase family protein n=1 Tax=Halorussus sp. MSC15.2 TaxID=2283638 RepID=UPI0013D0B8F1|nr:NAD(P)-dependent oxidoreductase [Halorussus sp. MSC15.2]NEU57651.1 NAD(P)-dependent oxidoreductase [Halorussus sp. MSC15.2]